MFIKFGGPLSVRPSEWGEVYFFHSLDIEDLREFVGPKKNNNNIICDSDIVKEK